MGPRNSPRLIAALLLIGAAAACRLALARRWTQRLPAGWTASSVYVGTLGYDDPHAGRLPDRDPVN